MGEEGNNKNQNSAIEKYAMRKLKLILVPLLIIVIVGCSIMAIFDAILDTIKDIVKKIAEFIKDPIGALKELKDNVHNSVCSFLDLASYSPPSEGDTIIIKLSKDRIEELKSMLEEGIDLEAAGLNGGTLQKMILASYTSICTKDTVIAIEIEENDYDGKFANGYDKDNKDEDGYLYWFEKVDAEDDYEGDKDIFGQKTVYYMGASGCVKILNENGDERVAYSEKNYEKVKDALANALNDGKDDYADEIRSVIHGVYTIENNELGTINVLTDNETKYEYSYKYTYENNKEYSGTGSKYNDFNPSYVTLDYQEDIAEYTTPLSFLVDLLNISANVEYIEKVCELVNGNKIEVMLFDLTTKTTTTETMNYNQNTLIEKEEDVSQKYKDKLAEAQKNILSLGTNLDTNGDGIADTNLDITGDGVADLNVDTDGDLVADLNLDTDLNGKPDVNVDTNGDKIADINIDSNGDNITDSPKIIPEFINKMKINMKTSGNVESIRTVTITNESFEPHVTKAVCWYQNMICEYDVDDNYIYKTIDENNNEIECGNNESEAIKVEQNPDTEKINKNYADLSSSKFTLDKLMENASIFDSFFSEKDFGEKLLIESTEREYNLNYDNGVQKTVTDSDVANLSNRDRYDILSTTVEVLEGGKLEINKSNITKSTYIKIHEKEVSGKVKIVKDNTDIFLGLLKNSDGKYKKGALFDSTGKYVEYKDIYEDEESTPARMLENGDLELFELLESDEDTLRLVDVMKYVIYRLTGEDYGVTTFEFDDTEYTTVSDYNIDNSSFLATAKSCHDLVREYNYWYPSAANISAGKYVSDGTSITHRFPNIGEKESERYIDCSAYVCWSLKSYNKKYYKLLCAYQILANPYGFEVINTSDAQAGDIVVRSTHTEIYAGNGRSYNCGSTNAIRSETSGCSLTSFTRALRVK